MHELSTIEKILEIILPKARKHKAKKIKKIYLQIGAFSDYETKWMNRYFKEFAKNTVAEGAELIIEKQKALIKCSSCSYERDKDLKIETEITCPECGSHCRIIGDSDYTIVNMKVI